MINNKASEEKRGACFLKGEKREWYACDLCDFDCSLFEREAIKRVRKRERDYGKCASMGKILRACECKNGEGGE